MYHLGQPVRVLCHISISIKHCFLFSSNQILSRLPDPIINRPNPDLLSFLLRQNPSNMFSLSINLRKPPNLLRCPTLIQTQHGRLNHLFRIPPLF